MQQALQNLAALSTRQKIAGAVAIALAIALVAGPLLWNRAPEYAVLFSNLDERDGGQIIAELQQRNIPYRMSPTGHAILVPQARVHETRLRLAADGLPKGSLAGFELMDGQKLGISQFNERVNYQRARSKASSPAPCRRSTRWRAPGCTWRCPSRPPSCATTSAPPPR